MKHVEFSHLSDHFAVYLYIATDLTVYSVMITDDHNDPEMTIAASVIALESRIKELSHG